LRIQPHELSFDHPKIRFEAPKAAPLLANIKLRADLSSSFCETLWVNIIFLPHIGWFMMVEFNIPKWRVLTTK